MIHEAYLVNYFVKFYVNNEFNNIVYLFLCYLEQSGARRDIVLFLW